MPGRSNNSIGHRVLRAGLLASTAALSSLYISVTSASAQTVQEQFDLLPPAADPTRIEERVPELEAPDKDAGPIIDEPDDIEKPATSGGVRFTLNDVMFDGVTVYDTDALADIAQEFVGTEVSISEVYEIARLVTVRYRNDGYILSRAIVPPQPIKDAKQKIRVPKGLAENNPIDGRSSRGAHTVSA